MAIPAEPRARMLRQAATLALIAAGLAAAIALVANLTRERIERNEQAWITEHLDALLPRAWYDNDPLSDTIEVTAPELLGTPEPVTIYRARRSGEPAAAVIRPVAPDGYHGPIELLVAIGASGEVIGVRVIRHTETPGLGDAFERRDVQWLERFRGRSLGDPPQQRWTVRRDGGDFDAFTGATITPRAIVKAVRRALEYFERHRATIFAQAES